MPGQPEEHKITAEWIEAWNAHDLDRVLTHYAESVEFFSPFVPQVLCDPGGRIRGKATLREYFAKVLSVYPNLQFDLYSVLSGVNSVAILYRSVKNLLPRKSCCSTTATT